MKTTITFAALMLCAVAGFSPAYASEPGQTPANGHQRLESRDTDLAVTDIFLDRLRNGKLWVRITNHGPHAVAGRAAELIVVVDGGGLLVGSNLAVGPGQTRTLNTGIVVDASQRTRDITVTVRIPGMRDLKPSNNTYRERVP